MKTVSFLTPEMCILTL
jgi:hypothetical protein